MRIAECRERNQRRSDFLSHRIFRIFLSTLFLISGTFPLLALRAGEASAPLFRAGCGRRVRLWDGECITGQILELNKDTLRMRTGWAARLELPRAAVSAIDPLPGWRTVFDAEPGEPAVGKSLTYTLKNPLPAGRVGVNFQERGTASGARWTVELLFRQGERARRVTVMVAGAGGHYEVDAGDLKGTARKVTKSPGWHRLIVQFTKRSLRLTCDDDVLWYNLDDGPGGDLQRVTIDCQRSAENEMVGGAVAWTEFCIERAVDEHPQPPTDAEQDAVRLLEDDQLFGRILQADRRIIQIEGRFGKRSLPWTAVSGCSFRRPAAPPKANEGAKVRLLVRSGLCAEPDILEGVVTANDERRLVLRHAILGELTLERGRVREQRPLGSEA